MHITPLPQLRRMFVKRNPRALSCKISKTSVSEALNKDSNNQANKQQQATLLFTLLHYMDENDGWRHTGHIGRHDPARHPFLGWEKKDDTRRRTHVSERYPAVGFAIRESEWTNVRCVHPEDEGKDGGIWSSYLERGEWINPKVFYLALKKNELRACLATLLPPPLLSY